MSDMPPPAGQVDPSPYQAVEAPKKSKAGLIVGIIIGTIVLLGGCCGIGFVAFLLPAIAEAREAAVQLSSQARLREVANGLVTYASMNNDTLPPAGADWAALLLDQGIIRQDTLYGPGPGGGSATGPTVVYFYVPASRLSFDGGRVLAYEHPDVIEGGGHIAFHDTRVEFFAEPEFSERINSLTLDDGKPWAPHLDVVID